MSSATTFAPAARSWATTSPPMPPAAPVTMATAPSRVSSSLPRGIPGRDGYRMIVIQSSARLVTAADERVTDEACAPSPIGQLTPVPPRPQ